MLITGTVQESHVVPVYFTTGLKKIPGPLSGSFRARGGSLPFRKRLGVYPRDRGSAVEVCI